jgi:hypothetical protein
MAMLDHMDLSFSNLIAVNLYERMQREDLSFTERPSIAALEEWVELVLAEVKCHQASWEAWLSWEQRTQD